ncbi:MAG: hypothetical protein K5672_02200 [Bacteroidaceae bacterium]|nr:hypothetical protein [Bacteroidaceae bacterium]
MAEQEKWKWQEPGAAWKGVGLYHVTLTITDRSPLLGRLEFADNDPGKAKVRRTAQGNAIVNCLLSIPYHHPEVQVLHFCLMPDHLHAVLYVRHTMPTGVKGVVRGFWQAAKKLGRASLIIPPNDIRRNYQEEAHNYQGAHNYQEGTRDYQEKMGGLQEETARLEAFSAGLREQMGDDAYYQLQPVFTEMPFIRPMGHRAQLPNTIRYIDMNPQRLATKRLKPGFFRVQRGIMIGGRSYDGVGNTTLLMAEAFAAVHVRSMMVKAAEQGDVEPLRNYKNSCVLAARKGTVMVSPFISSDEKQVMQVLLQEQLPFICLTDNGFRDYYKPSDVLFDACAAGRVLILSPWSYDAGKRHISRAECMALNNMAEDICNKL